MDGVQSFGEKRAIWRTIGQLCQSGGRSSNEKSPLLLGLFARKFIRRICALGKLAEGEQLGSNLLHVAKSSREYQAEGAPFRRWNAARGNGPQLSRNE
jgi:hypothetical protein